MTKRFSASLLGDTIWVTSDGAPFSIGAPEELQRVCAGGRVPDDWHDKDVSALIKVTHTLRKTQHRPAALPICIVTSALIIAGALMARTPSGSCAPVDLSQTKQEHAILNAKAQDARQGLAQLRTLQPPSTPTPTPDSDEKYPFGYSR